MLFYDVAMIMVPEAKAQIKKIRHICVDGFFFMVALDMCQRWRSAENRVKAMVTLWVYG